jgi:hypothetical protein
MNHGNNKKIFTLALAGLATGAAVWFLMSTDKGRRTRDYLVDSLLDNWQGKIKDFTGQTGEMVNGLKNRARNSVPMPS